MTVDELYAHLRILRPDEVPGPYPNYPPAQVLQLLQISNLHMLNANGPNGIPFYISHHGRFNELVEHDHSFFELVFVLHGELTHINREQTTQLPAGSVMMIRPGERHRFLPCGYDDLAVAIVLGTGIMLPRFRSVLGRLASIGAFLREDCADPCFFCQFGPNSIAHHLGELLLCSYFDPNSHSAISSELYLQLFLTEVDRAANPIAIRAESGIDADIPRISRYIQQHYASVSIEEVSREFGYTAEYISKKLKEHFGASFVPYRNRQCLMAAAALLTGTTRSISDIAASVGIPNASHFGKLFTAEYHMSPREYRQKYSA